MDGFRPIFRSALREDKTKFLDFFFIGASATKRFARSRFFRYGCLMIILSNRQKERGGGVQRTPCFKGLNDHKCTALSWLDEMVTGLFLHFLDRQNINKKVTSIIIKPKINDMTKTISAFLRFHK